MDIKNLIKIVLILILITAIPALANNFAKTTIYVNVASNTAFTMTILGCGATAITSTSEGESGTATTGDISFNSTTGLEEFVNAQSVGSCGSPTVQSGSAVPIITLDPTGNVPLNFSLRMNETFSDVVIWVNGTNFSSCGTSTANHVTAKTLSNVYQVVAWNISATACTANLTMYANFSGPAAQGIRARKLYTNSSTV